MLQCGAVCCWGCLEGLNVAVWSCLLLELFRGTRCCSVELFFCWGCLEGLDVAVWSCLLLGLFRGTRCCSVELFVAGVV